MMTLPNILTTIRVLLVPSFLVLLFKENYLAKLGAGLVFGLAAITDLIDGRVARARGLESELGKFMDPLADKILVITALFVFVWYPDILIPLWMVLVMVGRDVIVTLLRIYAMVKGRSIRTTYMAKLKTTFQMIVILVILAIIFLRSLLETLSIHLPLREEYRSLVECFHLISTNPFGGSLLVIPFCLMFITTVITVISGLRYLYQNRGLFFK